MENIWAMDRARPCPSLVLTWFDDFFSGSSAGFSEMSVEENEIKI
jgi:hypothetical protein